MKNFLKSVISGSKEKGWNSIFDTGKPPTGKAADSGYTTAKKQASQQENRQTVQNWWNNEQTKSAQDNSTNRAYTAKLTGGASIDNSTEMMKSLQRTFGGANDSAKTQYNRTLQSKQGYGRNWGNPRSAVGNAIESGVADTAAGWLNAAGTALKSDRRSGLAVDSGKVDAKTTGNEWYNRAGNYLQKEADWAQMLSENAYLRGSRNLNNAQKLLFDGAVAGTQMAADLALGALTGGSATIPMAIRSFGSGAQLARQEGASENQQILYGVANAAVEAATEKMFDGVARIHGKGMADDMVDDFAKRWAKSEGGQALVRGLVNAGGEGLEEIASGLAAPALQSIYNGKTLGENYRDLNMADLLHEGAVGMLLGNLGGAVNIAQTGRGNTQNYQQGNSRAFGGQMRNTTHADSLRNADLNSLYTAAESNTQRSKPYAAAYTTSVQQQRSTPHTANNETAGESQTLSYAKVFRQLQAEQEKTADLEYARYKELDRKFLDGSISEEEFEELRRLDNVWREADVPDKHAGTDGTSEYDRHKELERKFLDGNIDGQEWNEWIELEDSLEQVDTPDKRTTNGDLIRQERSGWRRLLEKELSGGIIKGIKSGALNPESDDARSHAERYYDFVRKMTTDVQKIAQNTGFSISDIQNIKDFVFYEEHELDGGVIRRFDPSYEMAESWQRLVDGKGIMPHDITLLHHELLEHSLMAQGMSQDEAHIIATRKYNYGKEAQMYHDQIKKHKK